MNGFPNTSEVGDIACGEELGGASGIISRLPIDKLSVMFDRVVDGCSSDDGERKKMSRGKVKKNKCRHDSDSGLDNLKWRVNYL